MTYIGSLSGGSSSSSSTSSTSFDPTGGISGLASGIDTDSIVQGLMESAQEPLIQLLQQRQITQWKQESYQRVNNTLTDLQNNLSSLQLQSTFLQNTTSSSNSALVSATVTGQSAQGSYSVSVQQLASGATISSTGSLSSDSNYPNTALADLPNNPLGVTSGQTSVSFTLNGQSFTVNPQTDTIDTVLQDINSNPSAGVTGFYDTNTGRVVLQTTATGSSAKIQVSSDPNGLFSNVFGLSQATSLTSAPFSNDELTSGGTVDINGVQFQFSTNESLQDVASAINQSSSTTGVTASYDTTSHELQLSGQGLYSGISVSDPLSFTDTSTILNLSTSDSAGTAQNAYYTVNGYSTSSSTNQPVYNGLTLSLGGVTSSPVSVTVSTNVNQIVQTITSFVQQYNETLQYMQQQYNTKQNFDYAPLTAAQASQMTSDQITEWNQQAQAGMLENDPMLGSTMSTLENTLSTTLSGQPTVSVNGQQVQMNSLSAIGITPIDTFSGLSSGATAPGVTTTGYNTYGLLQINTSQLEAAIEADPTAVMNLFTATGSTTSGGTTQSTNDSTGIAKQLYQAVTNSINEIQQQAGVGDTYDPTSAANLSASNSSNSSTSLLNYTLIDPTADLSTLFSNDASDTSYMGEEISTMDSQATTMASQLQDLQQRYDEEFSNMESAIEQVNSQSSYIVSMMGGASSSS